jgi:hypothetical protein
MANVDLSAARITEVPEKVLGITKGIRWTRDQQISTIELGYDYLTAADVYLGSAQVILADSSMPAEAWDAAKALVVDPAKTPEDLVAIMAGTEWGREIFEDKWLKRETVMVDGK